MTGSSSNGNTSWPLLQRNLQILGAFAFSARCAANPFSPATCGCTGFAGNAKLASPARPPASRPAPPPPTNAAWSSSDDHHDQQTATLVALIGRPGNGKTTLFNRLARRRDAWSIRPPWRHPRPPLRPGQLGGAALPAGGHRRHRRRGDPMAALSKQQALLAVEEAEVIFFMDGREGPTLRATSRSSTFVARKSRCFSSSTRSTARDRGRTASPSGNSAWTGCGPCPATTATA